MGYLAVIIVAYLLGSSSMAFYLAKLTKKDVSKNGSGNLGASNTVVLIGWRAGILVGIHDIGKAALAVLLADWIFPELAYAQVVAGVACILGHIFPFYLKFKGGKGLATYIGTTLALNWKLGLGVIVLLVIVTLITGYIVSGTVSTIVVTPVAMLLMGQVVTGLVLCVPTLVMLFRHQDNFARIKNGTEVRLLSAIKGEHKMK